MNLPSGIKVVTSEWCVEDSDEYEDKEVQVKRGGFWERIFDTDPTLHIWDDYKTKTIKVKKKKPVMYMLNGNTLFIHPEVIDALTKQFSNLVTAYSNLSTATRMSSYSTEDFRKAVDLIENFK